jgi:hypothetical protein
MYLDDRYDRETLEPEAGWEDNVMAVLFGDVWEANIEDLLSRADVLTWITQQAAQAK